MLINFYATLRPIVGQKTVDFPLPDEVTVRQLVDAVVTRFPPLRAELLDDQGELHGHVHVFVNGRDAPYLSDFMETIIYPADKVDIFPAVGGGEVEIQKIDEIHCIPLWALREYLEELGGTSETDTHVVGTGWTVDLVKIEPRHVGSLRIGQVRLEMEGTEEALAKLRPEMHKKTLRAGG